MREHQTEKGSEMKNLELTQYEAEVLYENLFERMREEDATGLPDNEVGEALHSIIAKLDKLNVYAP